MRTITKKAQTYYERALKLLPHDPLASNNLAMVYIARGVHPQRIDGF